MFNFVKLYSPQSLQIHIRYYKDSFFLWKTHAKLFHQCQEIVSLLEFLETPNHFLLPAFYHLIHLHPLDENNILVEFFVGIDIRLVVVLETRLTIERYIHIDIRIISN